MLNYQHERERALQQFKNGVTPIFVATNVALRGLDILRVAHLINFDLPRNIHSYVHRIKRTGRAGKSRITTAFINDKNSSVAKGIPELMKEFGGHDFRSGNNNSNDIYDYYAATNSYGSSDYGAAYGGFGNGTLDYGASFGNNASYGNSEAYGNNASFEYCIAPCS
ncbi:DEAD-box ATP-dependent RNA helicase 52C-like protein [Tanacetum coccineum]